MVMPVMLIRPGQGATEEVDLLCEGCHRKEEVRSDLDMDVVAGK
jgi:hypothetical protein